MKYINKTYEATYEIKKSVFTATLTPMNDEALIKPYLEDLKRRHPKSNHLVFAAHLNEGIIQKKSDDGEPKDTAGLPILTAINHYDLTNVILTVRRDFGGVLLGASGLIRAYSKAAHMALEKATFLVQTSVLELKLTLTYKAYDLLQSHFQKEALKVTPHFTDFVEVHLEILKDTFHSFKELIHEKYPHPIEMNMIKEKMTYIPARA